MRVAEPRPKKSGKRAPETWLDLFDCRYKDSSCESLAESIRGEAFGIPSMMHVTLRQHLVRELDAYLAAHWKPGLRQSHVEAAQNLSDTAERLAAMFEERASFIEADAAVHAAALRCAWVEFIAEGAGFRMYHDRPREYAQKQAAWSGPRAHGKKLTPAEVARRMKTKGVTELSQTLATEIGEACNVSDSTVYRRFKVAKKDHLLS